MYFSITTRFCGQDSRNLLRPGDEVRLKKEPNAFDMETIAVYKNGGRCGYVANSVDTVVVGTHSAGFISTVFDEECEAAVRFVSEEFGIAELADSK